MDADPPAQGVNFPRRITFMTSDERKFITDMSFRLACQQGTPDRKFLDLAAQDGRKIDARPLSEEESARWAEIFDRAARAKTEADAARQRQTEGDHRV